MCFMRGSDEPLGVCFLLCNNTTLQCCNACPNVRGFCGAIQSGGNFVLRKARVARQPGDGRWVCCPANTVSCGKRHAYVQFWSTQNFAACPNLTLLLLLVAPAPSCLFHSISYGLKRAGRSASAMALRREVANYLKRNAKMKISESPLGDWVKWDTGLSVEAYVEILVLALFFCNLQSRL